MKKLFFAAMFLLSAQFVLATAGSNTSNNVSVSGTVVDASTKKPLADVTIVAVNSTNKTTEIVTTNTQGQFKIVTLPNGTYTLKLSRDDYKNEKKDVVVKTDSTCKVTIELVAESQESNSHRSWWDKFDLYF